MSPNLMPELAVAALDGALPATPSKKSVLNGGHREPPASASKQQPLTFSKLGDWSTMTASRWHDAMYFEGAYFMQLWADTLAYTKARATEYCGGAARCTNVEVGSGTGDVILGMAKDFRYSVGLDINAEFLRYSRARLTEETSDRVKFVQGSATELTDIMTAEVADLRKGPVVVTCVNNTIGIFPDAIKPATYAQMQELAGADGIVIVGFWNGNKFGDALQHFYAKNPQLCGSMENADIDWEGHTLITAGGYRTHWSTPEEARTVLRRYGFEVVDVREVGVGVLCTCKGKAAGAPLPAFIKTPGRRRAGSRDWLESRGNDATYSSSREASPQRRAVEYTVTSLYDNSFQQQFYREIWGGKNQHVGLYEDSELDALQPAARVLAACDHATEHLFAKARPGRGGRVIEFGSGFGSTARHAAAHFDADVTCVDLSKRANEINRHLTKQAGLQSQVHIGPERSFFETGEEASSYSMVFSQDALCHASDQIDRALEEAARVLRDGGLLAFTNIVVDPQARAGELRQVLARLQLSHMESPDSLIAAAEVAGFELIEYEDTTPSLVQHYSAILEVLDEKRASLVKNTSQEYVTDAEAGLKAWQSAGTTGILRWGYFVFRKLPTSTGVSTE